MEKNQVMLDLLKMAKEAKAEEEKTNDPLMKHYHVGKQNAFMQSFDLVKQIKITKIPEIP